MVDKNAVIGEYKVYPNSVGLLETVLPANVPYEMNNLFESCSNEKLSLYDIADFHVRYESIHPFYDGNGRTGRLIMFKQCLDNDVLPFIVDDRDKLFKVLYIVVPILLFLIAGGAIFFILRKK